MTDVRERPDESRSREALIEKLAEAIWIAQGYTREHAGWLVATELGNVSVEQAHDAARAALATIEAEQQAEVAALVAGAREGLYWLGEAFERRPMHGALDAADRLQRALQPFERTLGSTRNEGER